MSFDQWLDGLETTHVDWFCSRGMDDLIVPNSCDTSEVAYEVRPPLAYDWLKKGPTTSTGFNSINKRPITTTEPVKEFNFEDVCNSPNWRVFDDCPDYQQQNLHQSFQSSSDVERMDEIFLNSLLEEDSCGKENTHESAGMLLDSKCRSLTVENLLTGILEDSWSIMNKSSLMGSSELNVGGILDDSIKKEEDLPLQFTPSESRTEISATRKEPEPTAFTSTESKSSHEADTHSQEVSLEEAVLDELKDKMSMLNQKTRICFRDALYRLARTSRQPHLADQGTAVEEHSPASVHKEKSRYNSTNSESETNVIDRTIMNLLFQQLDDIGYEEEHIFYPPMFRSRPYSTDMVHTDTRKFWFRFL